MLSLRAPVKPGQVQLFYSVAMTMLASGIAYRGVTTNSGLSATILSDGRKAHRFGFTRFLRGLFKRSAFSSGRLFSLLV